jgi:beta-mannosidase
LELPVAPNIEATLSKAGEDYTVTLKSPELARGVYLSFGDLDVHTADNYFDLIPGELVTVALQSAASLDQLKSALKITSLTEAFR